MLTAILLIFLAQVPDEIEPDFWGADTFPLSSAGFVCKPDYSSSDGFQPDCGSIGLSSADNCCDAIAMIATIPVSCQLGGGAHQIVTRWVVTVTVLDAGGTPVGNPWVDRGTVGPATSANEFSVPCGGTLIAEIDISTTLFSTFGYESLTCSDKILCDSP